MNVMLNYQKAILEELIVIYKPRYVLDVVDKGLFSSIELSLRKVESIFFKGQEVEFENDLLLNYFNKTRSIPEHYPFQEADLFEVERTIYSASKTLQKSPYLQEKLDDKLREMLITIGEQPIELIELPYNSGRAVISHPIKQKISLVDATFKQF